MPDIPIFSIVGYSGTGKTTYLERLIPELRSMGIRVAAVKHDGHDFEMDREGTDSWRLARAGSEVTVISSSSKMVLMESRPLSPPEVLSRIRGVDLILTEGFKHGPYGKIALYRHASGNPLPIPAEDCLAIVSDVPLPTAACPVFPLGKPRELAAWLALKLE